MRNMKLGLCISLFLAGYLYSCPVVAQSTVAQPKEITIKAMTYNTYSGRKMGIDKIADMAKKTKSTTNKPIADNREDTQSLQRRVSLLEYQLKEEQAKAAAFSTMIDIAEKELKISIRKK